MILAIISEQKYEMVIEWYQKLGILGGFFIAMFENFFPPLPIWLIVSANSIAFGTILGFLISFSGHAVGGIIVFYFVRAILKPRIDKHLKPGSKIRKFEKWIEKRSFAFLLVTMSQPFVPFSLVIFSAAISNIRKKVFIPALIIGNFIMISFLTYIGSRVDLIIKERDFKSLSIVAIILFAAFLLGKAIEKRAHFKEDD